MPKESKISLATGPLLMGVGGGLLVFAISMALDNFVAYWGWMTGGFAFLLIGVGLQEILLAVAEQSRKRSD